MIFYCELGAIMAFMAGAGFTLKLFWSEIDWNLVVAALIRAAEFAANFFNG